MFIGAGVVTRENIKIGNNSFVGAGAVVSKNIPDNVLSIGILAKTRKKLNLDDWEDLI
jgi:acetyltransferase-like isoleucine patch superfamily enzyme